jgi:hypothetical protein
MYLHTLFQCARRRRVFRVLLFERRLLRPPLRHWLPVYFGLGCCVRAGITPLRSVCLGFSVPTACHRGPCSASDGGPTCDFSILSAYSCQDMFPCAICILVCEISIRSIGRRNRKLTAGRHVGRVRYIVLDAPRAGAYEARPDTGHAATTLHRATAARLTRLTTLAPATTRRNVGLTVGSRRHVRVPLRTVGTNRTCKSIAIATAHLTRRLPATPAHASTLTRHLFIDRKKYTYAPGLLIIIFISPKRRPMRGFFR